MEVKRRTAKTLVTKLSSVSEQTRTESLCELRLISKNDPESRPLIAEAGAIPYLSEILYSPSAIAQENATATLLNISISSREPLMSTRGLLDALSHALRNPESPSTAQLAAATLFSLLTVDSYRPIIGSKRDILYALVDMIRNPNSHPRSIKDGLKALFGISLYPLNRATVIELGAVPALFSLVVKDGRVGIVEDATAVIAQLAEMSLLGFVKRKGKGYKATSRPLAPTEDFVLDRTAAVTYSIPETEKDDESRQPKGQTAENLGNLDRFLFSSDVPDKETLDDSQGKGSGSVDHDTVKATPSPVRSGGSKEDSADKVVLGVEATGVSPSPARKEHHRKRKISEDIVDETPQSGKKHRQASDDEGSKGSEYSYDITETYVPRWNVKNGDTLVDPAVCYQILHHAIPPGELDRAREKKEDYPAEGASVSIVRALSSVSELVQSYCKKSAVEKRLRGRIEEYRAEITKLDAKLAKRKKGDRSSIKKGKQAIRAMEEMKEKHAQETKLFQQDLLSKDKEIEELRERNRLLDEQNISLTKASSSLQERIDKAAEEKEAWRQCKVNYDEALAAGDKVIDQLKVFLEDAEKDRDRLATEVIPLVVSKLHKSTEFLEPLGEMETLLYNSAFHDGIVAGFEGCSAGLKVEEIEGYDVKANTVYETGVKTWESTTYPFIEGMKGLKGKTAADVEKLVPSGSLVKDVL